MKLHSSFATLARLCVLTPFCVALVAIAVVTRESEARDETARIAVKRLYAPASDVRAGITVLPSVESTSLRSSVALLIEPWQECDGEGNAEEAVGAVELKSCAVARVRVHHGGGPLRVIPLGPNALNWRVSIASVDDELRVGEGHETSAAGAIPPSLRRVTELIASQEVFLESRPTRCYEFEWRAGEAVIEMTSRGASEHSHAAILIDDGAAVALEASLVTRVNRAGDEFALDLRGIETDRAARIDVGADAGERGASVGERDHQEIHERNHERPFHIESASVRWSDGTCALATVTNDPARVTRTHSSRTETEWFTRARIHFRDAHPGDALVSVHAVVQDARGATHSRTIHFLALITPDSVRLNARAVIEREPDAVTAKIRLGVATLSRSTGAVFAASELWACGAQGERCLGWIGGLAEVTSDAHGEWIDLECPLHALAHASDERLELRAVRLHARDGCAVMDFTTRIEPVVEAWCSTQLVKLFAHDPAAGASAGPSWGRPGFVGIMGTAAAAAVGGVSSSQFIPDHGTHALALLHGYCADVSGWPVAHFDSDAWIYSNFMQNMSHDAFALDLRARLAPFKSSGVVSHSQGGCAALHLLTFYWSALDWAGDGRLIQALAAPFEGTALAGNLAALGEVFGVQCGANSSLTYDGAAAWLSLIPSAARARVSTWTTTFTDIPWSYDSCNLVTDVFLDDPEDGVVEHWSGHIIGANTMGLRVGWCHVFDMADPRNSTDPARNAEMNAMGAR